MYERDQSLAIGELYLQREPNQASLNEITALLYYTNALAEGLSDSETVYEIRSEFASNERERKEITGDKEARERIIGRLATRGDLKTVTSSKGRYLSGQRDGAVKVNKIRKESPFFLEIIGPDALVFIVLYLASGVDCEYTETIDEEGNSKVVKRYRFNPPNLQEAVETLRDLL